MDLITAVIGLLLMDLASFSQSQHTFTSEIETLRIWNMCPHLYQQCNVAGKVTESPRIGCSWLASGASWLLYVYVRLLSLSSRGRDFRVSICVCVCVRKCYMNLKRQTCLVKCEVQLRAHGAHI